jgi:hypothetical protein
MLNWERNYRILFRPDRARKLSLLAQQSASTASPQIQQFRHLLIRAVRRRRRLKVLVDHEREVERFVLSLLDDWRNAMVHSAQAYRPGLLLYADQLEKTLEDVLGKLVDAGLAEPPICISVDELIDWYQGLLV